MPTLRHTEWQDSKGLILCSRSKQEPRSITPTNITNGVYNAMKRSLLFIIIALPLLMMAIDWTIVTVALHALQQDLNTSVNWVGWVVTAFSFGYVIALPISSYLCARYGHYRVFMASVMVFTLASLFCGLVSNISWMILWRIIQAIGAAGLMPAATQIAVNHFGKDRDLGSVNK